MLLWKRIRAHTSFPHDAPMALAMRQVHMMRSRQGTPFVHDVRAFDLFLETPSQRGAVELAITNVALFRRTTFHAVQLSSVPDLDASAASNNAQDACWRCGIEVALSCAIWGLFGPPCGMYVAEVEGAGVAWLWCARRDRCGRCDMCRCRLDGCRQLGCAVGRRTPTQKAAPWPPKEATACVLPGTGVPATSSKRVG